MNTLKALAAAGQSPWLDNLQRSLVASGELARLIDRDGLAGITSNPSIFEKAIGQSDEYSTEIQKLPHSIHRASARPTNIW